MRVKTHRTDSTYRSATFAPIASANSGQAIRQKGPSLTMMLSSDNIPGATNAEGLKRARALNRFAILSGVWLNKILLRGFWCVLLIEVILPRLTEDIPMNIQHSTFHSNYTTSRPHDCRYECAQSRPCISEQSLACLHAFRCMAGANTRDCNAG